MAHKVKSAELRTGPDGETSSPRAAGPRATCVAVGVASRAHLIVRAGVGVLAILPGVQPKSTLRAVGTVGSPPADPVKGSVGLINRGRGLGRRSLTFSLRRVLLLWVRPSAIVRPRRIRCVQPVEVLRRGTPWGNTVACGRATHDPSQAGRPPGGEGQGGLDDVTGGPGCCSSVSAAALVVVRFSLVVRYYFSESGVRVGPTMPRS